jgi:hypothetical protein
MINNLLNKEPVFHSNYGLRINKNLIILSTQKIKADDLTYLNLAINLQTSCKFLRLKLMCKYFTKIVLVFPFFSVSKICLIPGLSTKYC